MREDRITALPWAFAVLFTVCAGGEAAAAPALPPTPLSVPVTLRSTASGALDRATFSAGIPVPAGAWRDGAQVVLVDGVRRTPTQVRVLGRWPDDSARWILIDTQASLAAGEVRTATLEIGAPPVPLPASPLKVGVKPDRILVDTGIQRFVVPNAGPALLATVESDGGSPAELRGHATIDGERIDANQTRAIEVVESGPWRVRVAVDGAYGRIRYRLRFDFFAGIGAVRVLHSIENHDPAESVTLDELALVAKLPTGVERLAHRSDDRGEHLVPLPSDAPMSVVQIDARRLQVGDDRRRARGDGWFGVEHGGRHSALLSRFFWQEYPQGVRVEGDRFVHLLRAPDGRALPFGSGAAKTHEVWWLLNGTRAEAEQLSARPDAAVLWLAPEYVRRTGALRNALAPAPATRSFLERLSGSIAAYEVAQDREEWDDSGRVACSEGDAQRRTGAYGLFNWGDWNFRGYRDDIKGCDAWGNLEYDTTQVLALAWVATGEPRLYDAMIAAARHFADVDRIHFSARHPEWVGMNHPKNPRHFTFAMGGIDLGHTWNEGLFTVGNLTGDERLLAAAREIADYLVRRRTSGIGFRGNPRQWGWPQIALVAAWENTGDERYREAAAWYAQRGIAGRAPDDLRDWKTGILAEGLAYTHSATGDPSLLAWLTAYAKAVAEARPKDARFYPALAYVGMRTGREEWRTLARETVGRLQLGRWGKPMTIGGRLGLSTLYWLETERGSDHTARASARPK